MPTPELLAPAGSMGSLTAALRCGADAVYVGAKSFSARQNASNFDFKELESALNLCHLYGKKLYLAVNTLIFDSQAEEFAKTIEKALALGTDAFIVQDLGAASIIRSLAPEARLHASTQMTIHSKNGALLAKELGFKRVVLSRELSAVQIKEISALGIETEIFVHGSLCMGVSGQCYLSSVIGRRSANRGICAQPCRLPFSAGEREGFALSLKDLSLIDLIGKIKSLGVSSLKIEGRMKRPEYVAAAVDAYRKALDGFEYDSETLKSVFSRSGFTDGYFTGKKDNMFGIREKDDAKAAKDVFPKIHELYRTERKVSKLNFSADIQSGLPLTVFAWDEKGNKACASGTVPQKALNKAADCEFITRQLSKLGDTVFYPGEMNIHIEDGLAVSASELNRLRRSLTEQISADIIKSNRPVFDISDDFPKISRCSFKERHVRARISRLSALNAALKADYVIIPLELFSREEIPFDEKIIIEPPRFIKDEKIMLKNLEFIKSRGFNKLMCENIAHIKAGMDMGFELHGGFGLNVLNSYTAALLTKLKLRDVTLSIELKASQGAAIKSPVPAGIAAYGNLPVMLTANCPIKNQVGCKKCQKKITDRMGKNFPVLCYGDYTEILNSQKLYLADKLDDFETVNFFTLYFTDENPEEISEIIDSYQFGGEKKENITRGLCYRGVI